jgi:hypothetical protein
MRTSSLKIAMKHRPKERQRRPMVIPHTRYLRIACKQLSHDASADICRAAVSDTNRKGGVSPKRPAVTNQ